ncbi:MULTISPECIES: winged helix-turn-helix domain-containing protein [unclassified Chelatococcus]|uniref:winged helix-turn-helix domain-containing protein n=1 Tax=unclassified Chelatococcus TaxID=2638111 RepID=UPI0002D8E580|nr:MULTISPECIES: winged helix-turn-helix domain-containing protein [unclassified Chelatococcus]
MASQRFSFGPFLLDTGRGVLLERGVPVSLGRKPLALLRALAEARGQVVTKSALMDAAWPNSCVEESNLTVQIAALRKRLGEEWIATFPRVGYRFAGPLAVEEGEVASTPARPADIEPDLSASTGAQIAAAIAGPAPMDRMPTEPAVARHTIAPASTIPRRWQWRATAAAMALVMLFMVAGTAGWLRPWSQDFEPRLPLPDKPSIAVLPFTNLTLDRTDDYFSDGIVDDLITDLSRVSGLFVIARNSTFTYKDKPVEIRDVAQELGVRYVLQGSIQRAGDQVRVNVHLVDAATGGQQWAERYSAPVADIFALQDKVTRAVVGVLSLRLTDAERTTLHRAETGVPEAYDAFLQGWNHYRRTTPEGYAAAVPYFERAIELDPDYGRAYAALALVYAQAANALWSYRLGIPASESLARARRYLLEAQKRPTALAHQVAATLLQMNWKHARALEEIQQAIALDPGEPWNYAVMSLILTSAGRPRDAVPHMRTAMRLDPHSPPYFWFVLGLMQFSLDDFAGAATSLERVVEYSPDAECLLLLAAAYAHLGRGQDARSALSRFNEVRLRRGGVPVTIATAVSFDYTAFGDRERLKEGLALAGVPKSLDELAKNRLPPAAVRDLFLGHRLHGRSLATGEERAASITAEGIATLSGDWGTIINGKVEIDDDAVCYVWSGGVRFCGTVVHNPGGTKAAENELIWIDARGAFAFSQAD